PSNQHNPDTTDNLGGFHWDVVPGYSKVQVSKSSSATPAAPASCPYPHYRRASSLRWTARPERGDPP
ncbi:MAG: hypothetical protein ACR2PL_20885, partial [Dehalococcoidia bacterium]